MIALRKASHIAKGGFFTALSLLLIYMSILIPSNKHLFLGIASCMIPICILTTDIKNSILVYISTCMLSFFLFGISISTITYIFFWGLYGFIKLYIEKLNRLPLEIVLKLIYFNIILFLVYMLFNSIFKLNSYIYVFIAAFEIGFIIYDYVLSFFINYISTHYIKKLK